MVLSGNQKIVGLCLVAFNNSRVTEQMSVKEGRSTRRFPGNMGNQTFVAWDIEKDFHDCTLSQPIVQIDDVFSGYFIVGLSSDCIT